MTHSRTMPFAFINIFCSFMLGACGGGSEAEGPPVTITPGAPNAVSTWNEIAATTVNGAAAATGTAEEQRPTYAVDLATVNLAIYDSLMAITPTHKPFAIVPVAPSTGASQEAAVASAAYRVLVGLFPNRGVSYQAAYGDFLATLPDGEAKSRGLALGAEVAAGILAMRANDGRSVALAPYVPGTEPGQFRGTNPIGRPNAYIKPFAMTSASQFRVPAPPSLSSDTYAADFNETRLQGSATSTSRTADQTELARFATENPGIHWARNIRSFATGNASLGEHSRLMAMIWVAHADATIACFESKYHYQAWRPASAIALAENDGNAQTAADPAWVPIVATPNHPEYPAAHSCTTGATMGALRAFHNTSRITFAVNSTASGTTRNYTSTQALTADMATARINGGMHFRTSAEQGAVLGQSVADWVTARHFQPR